MHLIINPSDIYYVTGVRPHDPGEMMVLMTEPRMTVFCDARTSVRFDPSVFNVIDRSEWQSVLAVHKLLEVDPDALTMSFCEKLESY